MSKPYLLAEIPFGPDGHIVVREPGAPLDEIEAVALMQKVRDQESVVRPEYIAVARPSLQSSGRVGRAVLALCRIDTDRLTPERRREVESILLRRLESAGELAQHESMQGARGAVVDSPLLKVWSELEGLDKLPVAAPTPETPLPPPRRPPSLKVGLLGLAAVAALAAVTMFWPRGDGPPAVSDTPAPSKGGSSPDPRSAPRTAAVASTSASDRDRDLLKAEIAAARSRTIDFGSENGSKDRQTFETDWPKRLGQGDPAAARPLFEQYRTLLGMSFDASVRLACDSFRQRIATPPPKAQEGALPRATTALPDLRAALDEFCAALNGLDRWLGALRTGLPDQCFSNFEEKFQPFENERRAVMKQQAAAVLRDAARDLIAEPKGRPRPPWADLQSVAGCATGRLPWLTDDANPPAGTSADPLHQLRRFAALVEDFSGCGAEIQFRLRLWNLREYDPPGFVVTYSPSIDIHYVVESKEGRYELIDARETKGPDKMFRFYVRSKAKSPTDGVVVELRYDGRLTNLFDARVTVRRAEATPTKAEVYVGDLFRRAENGHKIGEAHGLQWQLEGDLQKITGGQGHYAEAETLPVIQLETALGSRREL
jgi:hypothetical protein